MPDLSGAAAERAVDEWNGLLDSAPYVADDVGRFHDEFVARDLFYGDRSVCSVFRPRFVTKRQNDYVESMASLVQSAISKTMNAIEANPTELTDLIGKFHPIEREVIGLDNGFHRVDMSVRLDGFFTPTGFNFVESSGTVPSLNAQTHELGAVFEGLEIFAEFSAGKRLRRPDIHGAFMTGISKAWHIWADDPSRLPRVAIVDFLGGVWANEPEFRIFHRWFDEAGFPVTLVDPGELSCEHGVLYDDAGKIDMVFRRLLMWDIMNEPDRCRAIVDAAKTNAVCMVNPLGSTIGDRKAMMALLSDPDLDFGYTDDEKTAIHQTVPWTKIFNDAKTELPDGKAGDLADYCAANRSELVLKPNHDYGGHNIHLGWTMDDSSWRSALDSSIGHDYVVQTRIAQQRETYPTIAVDPEPVTMLRDTNPYMSFGVFGGVLTRLSTSELCNVTQGGSINATFIIDD